MSVKFNLPLRFRQIFAAERRLDNLLYFSGGREKIGIVRERAACQTIDCIRIAAMEQVANAEQICSIRRQCVVNKRIEAIEPVAPREFHAGCIKQRQRRIEKLLAHIVKAIRLHAENASFAFNAFKNVVIFVAAGVNCPVDDTRQLDSGGGFGEVIRFCLKRFGGVTDFKGPGGGRAVFTDDAHFARADGGIGRYGELCSQPAAGSRRRFEIVGDFARVIGTNLCPFFRNHPLHGGFPLRRCHGAVIGGTELVALPTIRFKERFMGVINFAAARVKFASDAGFPLNDKRMRAL